MRSAGPSQLEQVTTEPAWTAPNGGAAPSPAGAVAVACNQLSACGILLASLPRRLLSLFLQDTASAVLTIEVRSAARYRRARRSDRPPSCACAGGRVKPRHPAAAPQRQRSILAGRRGDARSGPTLLLEAAGRGGACSLSRPNALAHRAVRTSRSSQGQGFSGPQPELFSLLLTMRAVFELCEDHSVRRAARGQGAAGTSAESDRRPRRCCCS